MKGSGRRLVVDADVGRGAADVARAERTGAVDPRARAFARCLDAVLQARHRLVMGPTLREEWRRHVTGNCAGGRWLARMIERGLVVLLDREPDADRVRDDARAHLPHEEIDAALKDPHLVAAAVAEGDRRVLSGDDRARDRYTRVAARASWPALHWVNPAWDVPGTGRAAAEEVRAWLLERAPDRPEWTLGGP